MSGKIFGLALLASTMMVSAADAATMMFDISGTAGDAGAFTGTLNLEVTNGIATSGTGTISILSYVDAPLVLITTDTPGNETTGGPSAPVGFRDNHGTDLYGADQVFPLTVNGLLFDVGTDTAAAGQFPLLNLFHDQGRDQSLFTGEVDGVEHYVQFGSLVITPSAAGAVPEPASWALMLGGFGLVGSALRRRRVSVSFG